MTAMAACRPTPSAPALHAPAPLLPATEPDRAWTTRSHFKHLTFQNPVFAVMPPRDPGRWFIGEREGRVYSVAHDPDASEKVLVLDLRANTLGWQDCGLLNLAFHPDFGKPGAASRGHFYVWYNHTDQPHPGPDHPFHGHPSANRLTRFTIPDGARVADPASALVMIEQPRNNTDHHGGGMFFHPGDGFLYLGVGDGGHPLLPDPDRFAVRPADDPQRLDRDLLSGVIRIDVDRRGGAVSHPIRRQPRNGRTQGYFIPSDNPWVDPGGQRLEEFWAIGLRNPHRMTHDPVSGRIFLGDVGAGKWEEIDVVERGANYQWNYLEGPERAAFPRPEKLIGQERGPLHAYQHQTFAAVIGGLVYRGQEFPGLRGKYLFGDNGNGRIWTLDATATAPARVEMLLRLPQEMAAYGGLSSFATDARGELYVTVLGDNQNGTGTLRRLVRPPAARTPMPRTLSETRLFQDLGTLTPRRELFPYEVNAPFWSDHKVKTRWLAVPDGGHIGFRAEGEWRFPPGTIAVKHFDLAHDERDPTRRRRLETRVLVMDAHGGAYGRTYKWRADQRDADLLVEPVTEHLTMRARAPFGPLHASALDGREGEPVEPPSALATPGGARFLQKEVSGDFDFAALLEQTAGGRAGLMLREALGAEDAELFVSWREGRLRIEHRPRGGQRQIREQPAPGPWLRLARWGKTLAVFSGEDGQRWSRARGELPEGEWARRAGLALLADGGPGAGPARTAISDLMSCRVRDHYYPGNDECMACHTESAGHLLGASTRQWNRIVAAADGPTNQLVLASRRHLFDREITRIPTEWKRLAALDDERASLEDRARSYLDANCSQCHRPGNVVQVSIDARYDTPLARQGLIGALVRWPRGARSPDRIVAPHDPGASRLYKRISAGNMPPLGTLIRNTAAAELLEKWILGLR